MPFKFESELVTATKTRKNHNATVVGPKMWNLPIWLETEPMLPFQGTTAVLKVLERRLNRVKISNSSEFAAVVAEFQELADRLEKRGCIPPVVTVTCRTNPALASFAQAAMNQHLGKPAKGK